MSIGKRLIWSISITVTGIVIGLIVVIVFKLGTDNSNKPVEVKAGPILGHVEIRYYTGAVSITVSDNEHISHYLLKRVGDIAFIDFMKSKKELEAITSIGHYDAGFE